MKKHKIKPLKQGNKLLYIQKLDRQQQQKVKGGYDPWAQG